MTNKKETTQKDYFIHADFYDELISVLKERFVEYQQMDKRQNLKGESLGTHNLRIALERIEEKGGDNLTPFEVNTIFLILMEKILGKVIE